MGGGMNRYQNLQKDQQHQQGQVRQVPRELLVGLHPREHLGDQFHPEWEEKEKET